MRPGGRPSTTLIRRVEAAAAFGARYRTPLFVPTGGVGRFGPSEASVMAGLLMARDVPAECILLEETATDTLSSVRALARMLPSGTGAVRARGAPVFVASSGYHQPRCLMLLRLAGISAGRCPPPPAAAGLMQRWYWRFRETVAVPYDVAVALVLRLFDRL